MHPAICHHAAILWMGEVSRFPVYAIPVVPASKTIRDRGILIPHLSMAPHLSQIPQANSLIFAVADAVSTVPLRCYVGDPPVKERVSLWLTCKMFKSQTYSVCPTSTPDGVSEANDRRSLQHHSSARTSHPHVRKVTTHQTFR